MLKKSIGVVGLGKLGLPLSLVFAKAGFVVHGVDINKERIGEIKAFQHIRCHEPKVTEYLLKYGASFELSADYRKLKGTPIIVVIVQTPSLVDGHYNLSYVEEAVQKAHDVNEHALIVVSSNITIGSIDQLSKIHKRICYNPEFIRQGSIIHDFENPKFVLIGAYTKEDGEQVTSIWRKIHDKPTYIVKPVEAEIIKLSLNVSFTLGITFANMIGELCEKFNADSSQVLDVIYHDRRDYKAGLGFAGPCFPRDVNYFKTMCIKNALWSGDRFTSMLNDLNNYFVDRYIQKIKSSKRRKVGILGVAYKPNVPYVYESQPLKIAKQLLQEGYEVYIYDPLAEENAKQVLNNKAHFCSTIKECVDEVEIIFIGTVNYSNVETDKSTVNPWR